MRDPLPAKFPDLRLLNLNILDRPVIVAYLVIIVLMFVILNLIVDITYAILDPRVRQGITS